MHRRDIVPRRWVKLPRRARDTGLARRQEQSWFGVEGALLSRRSRYFPELPCLQVGGEPEKS